MDNLKNAKPVREGQHSEFVSQEKGCKHIGRNVARDHVRQYKIDGGVLPANQKPTRCDFMLVNDTKKTVYYIECKGSDIPKAIAQIESTEKMFGPVLSKEGYQSPYYRIIYRTGTQKLQSSTVIKWKAKFVGRAKIASREFSEDI